MPHYTVSVPDLNINETYVEAYKASHAARSVAIDHDHGHLSLRPGKGLEVIVTDERAKRQRFRVRGKVSLAVEEILS